ncbi:Flp pilus assembly complex ATPase component TadA [Clostridium sp. 'deep sea']|uniref:GspE/PulE family protein n=1 Tax=Clostridium sp. 'deep sea' TaxID=2779445 RepID=UPI00189667F0|nr:GspE/PulE family protein [Clostridium sp. 'deep sea']QOR35671.1 Flp pilus assembly complex ATPase component TadA [Clostridium sp. 'deep sea']
MNRQVRLGDLLLDRGLISKEQLQDALSKQHQLNLRVGETLIECGYVTEEDIALTLSDQFKIPFEQVANLSFEPEAVNMVNQALVERHKFVPVSVNDNEITLATADPTDVLALDDIKFATKRNIKLIIVTKRDIERAIEWLYLTPEGFNNNSLNISDFVDISDDDAPLIRMVNAIIQQSVEDSASDIHIEPSDYLLIIRYRIDGLLQMLREMSMDLHNSIVARIKIMANLDISERRLPQDGAFRQFIGGREIDFRVSTIPTIRGEKIVIRIHDNTQNRYKVDNIGMQLTTLKKLQNLLSLPYGMILVTGPTGSGKTTSLYSCLDVLNSPHKNIISIEDPTEYRLNGINQISINKKIGLTYSTVLRSILRQDPNIIMVGEIRDKETAEVSIRAALTGHLVLSTIHTNDAASTLTRLMDMGVAEFLIASSIAGIVAQRLVRRVCSRCRKEYFINKNDSLWSTLNIDNYIQNKSEILLFKAGDGCSHCHNTGYRGRIGIFELLIINETIAKMVMDHQPASVIKDYAVSNLAMQTLRDDAIIKVLSGITTVEELMGVSYFKDFMS